MSVVSVKEIHEGRGGGDAIEKAGGAKADIIRKFRVITSSPYDGADTVLRACDNLGVVHPTANWLYVMSRRAVNEPFSKLVWIATLKYSFEYYERTENPLVQPAVFDWQTETAQENATKDKDDNAVLNSADDYYENGVPVEDARWVVKVATNVAYVPEWIDDYRNAINNDTFFLEDRLIDVGMAKVSGITIGKWAMQNDIWYKPFGLTIKIRGSWVNSIMDMGLYRKVEDEFNPGTYLRMKCIDGAGVEVNKPVHLDGSGGQLTDPTPETAVFNEHNIYPEQPFSALPLY